MYKPYNGSYRQKTSMTGIHCFPHINRLYFVPLTFLISSLLIYFAIRREKETLFKEV